MSSESAPPDASGSGSPTYRVTINGKKFVVPEADASSGLKSIISRLRGLVESGRKESEDFEAGTWCVVRDISDLLGGTSFPDPAIWDAPLEGLDAAQGALGQKAFADAAASVNQAAQGYKQCQKVWTDYLDKSSKGASTAISGLETTVDLAIAIEAGLASGGLADVVGGGVSGAVVAGSALGGASSMGADAFNQEVAISLGNQAGLDWHELTVKGIEGVASGIVGGLAGGPVKSWMTEHLPGIVGSDYALWSRLSDSLQEVTGEPLASDVLLTKAQFLWGTIMTKLPVTALQEAVTAAVNSFGSKPVTADDLLSACVHQAMAKDLFFGSMLTELKVSLA
jgi:hypothetical protein